MRPRHDEVFTQFVGIPGSEHRKSKVMLSGCRPHPAGPPPLRSMPFRSPRKWLITMARVKTVHTKTSRAFAAPPEICAMLQSLGEVQTVPRLTTLFCKGDAPRGVFVVVKGRVALSAGDDTRQITRIAAEHSLLGLPSTVGNRHYSLTARTVTDTQVCVVPAAEFRKSMASNPALGLAIVNILSNEVSALRRIQIRAAQPA